MMMKRAVFAALWVLDVRVLADSLYTVLGLTHSATAPEIKKAYYKKALKLHPDKNPDDPKAKELFQKASEAYQVRVRVGVRVSVGGLPGAHHHSLHSLAHSLANSTREFRFLTS